MALELAYELFCLSLTFLVNFDEFHENFILLWLYNEIVKVEFLFSVCRN